VAGGSRRGNARPDRPGDGPARRRGGARPVGLEGDGCPRACRGLTRWRCRSSPPSPLRKGDLSAADGYAERLSGNGRSYGSAYGEGAARLVTAQVSRPAAARGPHWTCWLACWANWRSTGLFCWPIRATRPGWSAPPSPWKTASRQRTSPPSSEKRPGPTHVRGHPRVGRLRRRAAGRRHFPAGARGRPTAGPVDPLMRDRRPGCPARRGGHGDEAARAFDEALRQYAQLGAGRDVARTRHRLRELGIRHRHWGTAKRPAAGWESLTDHRAGHGPPRRPGTDKPADSRSAVHQHAHGRVPPCARCSASSTSGHASS